MSSLSDKVAIITGASRGIGAAAGRVFARAGASVVLAARDEQGLAVVVHEITTAGGRSLAVPTDVGDPPPSSGWCSGRSTPLAAWMPPSITRLAAGMARVRSGLQSQTR